MLPIISKREDLLIFYKKLAEEPQGFQRFVESYAFDFCNQIEFKWGHIKEQDIHIFAGVGLNGRYALAIAKELSRFTTKRVWVYIYSLEYRPSEELEHIVQEIHLLETVHLEVFDLAKGLVLPNGIRKNDLLIDGLSGYEEKDVFSKPYLDLFKALNQLDAIKLSIEVPSGITFSNIKLEKNTESIFKADHCWGIGVPTLKMFLEAYEEFFGTCKTLNSSEQYLSGSKFSLVEEEDLRKLLLNDKATILVSDKLSIIGLDPDHYGSLLIMGRSALAGGARDVQILTKGEASIPLQMAQPELKVSSFLLEETSVGIEGEIALGSSLSKNLLDDLWKQTLGLTQKPIVVSANVTKSLLMSDRLLSLLPKGSYLVLDLNDTPSKEDSPFDQILRIQSLAQKFELNFLVLSNRAYVCSADGKVLLQGGKIDSSLSKANLEVVTGLILNLLVGKPKLSAPNKLSLAAYIYQEAIILSQRRCKGSIVLSDEIIKSIPEVWATLNK